jgi:hypothetical protein
MALTSGSIEVRDLRRGMTLRSVNLSTASPSPFFLLFEHINALGLDLLVLHLRGGAPNDEPEQNHNDIKQLERNESVFYFHFENK